jgi:hypothetical protein
MLPFIGRLPVNSQMRDIKFLSLKKVAQNSSRAIEGKPQNPKKWDSPARDLRGGQLPPGLSMV